MVDTPVRAVHAAVVLLAARVGWVAYEFVFRHYGPGTTTGPLLDASPAAAAAAGIAWMVTTLAVAGIGVVLVRAFRGVAS